LILLYFILQTLKDVDQKKSNIHEIISEYAKKRKLATDTLADLCIEHYNDMAENTRSSLYLLNKKFESFLSETFPDYFFPLYSMVSFSNLSYNEAVEISKKQDKYIKYFYAVSIASTIIAVGSFFTIKSLKNYNFFSSRGFS